MEKTPSWSCRRIAGLYVDPYACSEYNKRLSYITGAFNTF